MKERVACLPAMRQRRALAALVWWPVLPAQLADTISAHSSAAPPRRVLQASSSPSAEGDTVIFGVIDLLTSEALNACASSCVAGVAAAFDVTESNAGCACPDDESSSRRQRRLLAWDGPENYHDDGVLAQTKTSLSLSGPQLPAATSGRAPGSRNLRALAVLEERVRVGFTARVGGGIAGGAAALDLLSSTGMEAVASAFGVEESEVSRPTQAQIKRKTICLLYTSDAADE